jgi:RNA polymerase sigma-70 factor (ECF subfamily)
MGVGTSQKMAVQRAAEQFHTEIFNYIRSKVGDTTNAEDLTQETFLKMSRALAHGSQPEHLRGWLYQIARNTIVDFLKAPQNRRPLPEPISPNQVHDNGALDSGDDGFRKSLFSYTLKVIETLPAEDRLVLTLTETDGLSREELATQLGISVSAAKSRVQRARAKLRRAVEDCCRLITDPYGRIIDWLRRTRCCADRTNSVT